MKDQGPQVRFTTERPAERHTHPGQLRESLAQMIAEGLRELLVLRLRQGFPPGNGLMAQGTAELAGVIRKLRRNRQGIHGDKQQH